MKHEAIEASCLPGGTSPNLSRNLNQVTRSHKASDDHVLSTHGINAVAVAVARRLDRGPWAVP